MLKLFRSIEEKIVGREASAVRDGVKRLKKERQTGMGVLAFEAPSLDQKYAEMNLRDRGRARNQIVESLQKTSQQWEVVWPRVLESCHITLTHLNEVAAEMQKDRIIRMSLRPRERVPKDETTIDLVSR